MLILGIETSCDETAAAVVNSQNDQLKLLSNVVATSLQMHQKTGGVVPEVAARAQLESILPVITKALEEAGLALKDIDKLAVTFGPGLVGPLLVGVETVKALGLVLNKPIVPVNHLLGHIFINMLEPTIVDRLSTIDFPLIALIVSGGHTDLICMNKDYSYKWLGGTRDDAAGEAFDKVARLLDLGFPGGPAIEKIAKEGLPAGRQGNPNAILFPRPMINSGDFDFSFSGLKTAVLNVIQSTNYELQATSSKADIAASFQQAVIDVLVAKTLKAAQEYEVGQIIIGGGVAANEELRKQLKTNCQKMGIKLAYPSKSLSTDNGAMVATAAFFLDKVVSPLEIQATPGLYF
ncbi:MAG TPA: tRNA (adenosine(37)-N6)-threonylcarbamoyltransferase complex transferase subunit TsaD [Patescibacteria group bacterium]